MKKVELLWVVDDDPTYVFTIKIRLQHYGYSNKLDVFSDGKEAFDKLQQIHEVGGDLPDLILLDLNMPIWDGWDFLNEIEKAKMEDLLTVYIISSSNNPQDLRRSEQYKSVQNFFVKPIDLEELSLIINKEFQ